MAENSSIIVCGQRFDVGVRVITYEDDPSISAYTPHCVGDPSKLYAFSPAKGIGQSTMRYRGRRLIGTDRSLSRLQHVLKQFVVHHDGMGNSRDCFKVLHDERGLSVHFLLDNNGDVYQTLDLVECGFQAAGVNEISVGVELCSRGDNLNLTPGQSANYARYKRDRVTCTINRHQWLCWDYTQEQYQSMVALGRALARILPGLPQTYPQAGDGEPMWDTLAGDPREFSGYLGHFHVTDNKWDPGPWDFKKFIQSIRGRTFYPAIPRRERAEPPPELPDDPEQAGEIARVLYDNNEKEGEGGYFPVGPLGETRLWHGGLHIRDEAGKPLVAPFSGRIVLARQKKQDDWPPVGSPNFVLLRHEMSVAGTPVKFFSLLMHVGEEAEGAMTPGWLRNGRDKRWMAELRGGEATVIDEPIGAGDVVAHFGEAGRAGDWKGQVHFEIFAAEEIGAQIEPGAWKALDGTAGGRFCQLPEIVAPIDLDRSQSLAHSEIVRFFQQSPAREQFHGLAVRHLSEWGDRGDFEAALNQARDFGRLPKAKKHQLFATQIEPYLWWGDNLSAHGLPDDKVVWGYHPIRFVLWLNEKMKGAAQKAQAIKGESEYGGKAPPPHIKDDTADGAEGFTDDEDALHGEAAKSLDLEKLAAGYPD